LPTRALSLTSKRTSRLMASSNMLVNC
jgi:hypothetical protein